MAATVRCPNADCDASFAVNAAQLGRAARCPRCGSRFTLALDTDPRGTPAPPPIDGPGPGVPAAIGRYRVARRLGRGGMGSVYLAHDPQLDRPVAVKVPDPTLAHDPAFLERFRREARAAAAFRHPNFCPVYEVGQQDDGLPFLVMAYIEGKPLSDLVADGRPTPPREAARIVRELALALAEAHRRGIVHRDLKPGNVMVDQGGTLIIMDFGLARRATGDEPELTRTGAAMGTPAYMSPEQVHGEKAAIGPSTDLYALGVILYELLAGRRPFQGTVSQVFVQVATQPPVPPSAHVEGLDPALEAICLEAMAKDPADRPPDADALAERLGRWLDGVDHGLTAVGEGEEGTDVASPSRRGLLIGGAAALGLAALGGGLAMGLGRGDREGSGSNRGGGPSPAPTPSPREGPAPARIPPGGWALDFDGSALATTDFRYGGGPIMLEAVVSYRGSSGPNLLGNILLARRPGQHPTAFGMGLGLTRDGFWCFTVRDVDEPRGSSGAPADLSGRWVRLKGWYAPARDRVAIVVDGVAGRPEGVGEVRPLPPPFLLGGTYLGEGPRQASTKPTFIGQVAWIRISDAVVFDAAEDASLDPPPATSNTRLLLDFTTGPDDPEIHRALDEGRLTLDGARFVRIDQGRSGGQPEGEPPAS